VIKLNKNLKGEYSPLFFLGSLGSGGLGVSFYMYLMFMIKHPKTPMATFSDIFPLVAKGDMSSFLIMAALALILFFSLIHFYLLIWNIKEYRLFKTTQEFQNLKKTNNEVSLMSIPLTLAMSVNVCFVLGAVFVPGLWSVVEFMFPIAILAFIAIGIYGLRIYGEFVTRLITKGDFEFEKNSNFSQMLAIFAFSMVSVGLAAPGAMSHHVSISAAGLFFSLFFMILSLLLLLKSLILGFKSMYRYGITKESTGSLWMLIPIATLLGIAIIRISFGLVHNFSSQPSPSSLFFITSTILGLQILVGIFGYKVMKTLGYFESFIHSEGKSVGALGLICPGVAFFVFGMFFIFFGLLKNNVIEIFSLAYFIILTPFMLVQLKTIQTFFRLFKKLFLVK
jgi:hypothetical protein